MDVRRPSTMTDHSDKLSPPGRAALGAQGKPN
jgi:hypothetical protein